MSRFSLVCLFVCLFVCLGFKGALHAVACACGVFACINTSYTYTSDTMGDMVGSEPGMGDALGLVIGGIISFALGCLCCCLDNFDKCTSDLYHI